MMIKDDIAFCLSFALSLSFPCQPSLPIPAHLEPEVNEEVYSDPNEVIAKVPKSQLEVIQHTSPESRYKSTPEISNSVPVCVGGQWVNPYYNMII